MINIVFKPQLYGAVSMDTKSLPSCTKEVRYQLQKCVEHHIMNNPEKNAGFLQFAKELNASAGVNVSHRSIASVFSIQFIYDKAFTMSDSLDLQLFSKHAPLTRDLSSEKLLFGIEEADVDDYMCFEGLQLISKDGQISTEVVTLTWSDLPPLYQALNPAKRLESFEGFNYKSIDNLNSKLLNFKQDAIGVAGLNQDIIKTCFKMKHYSPSEIVSFMVQSAADLLKLECQQNLTSSGVHVLELFSNGVFISKIIESPELVSDDDIEHKVVSELHSCSESLEKYVLSNVNTTVAYQSRKNGKLDNSWCNNMVILSDPTSPDSIDLEPVPSFNNENLRLNWLKRKELEQQPIHVIFGDFCGLIKNEAFDKGNEAAVYEWVTSRLSGGGVVALTLRSDLICSDDFQNLRAAWVGEFSSIYVYCLREENGFWGQPSNAEPVILTFLVKGRKLEGGCKVYFGQTYDICSESGGFNELCPLDSNANTCLKEVELEQFIKGLTLM